MNRIFLVFICCSALFWQGCNGCKENNTPIDFGHKSVSDTEYVLLPGTFPSTADGHNVLVEEFTGAKCSNCPGAHDLLNSVSASHPGRINVVGLHIFGTIQGGPVGGSIHDFRDSTANQINNSVYGGLNSLPGGGVDRIRVGGKIYLDKDAWTSAIVSQLDLVDSLNLEVKTGYNASAGIDTIIVKITYILDVKTMQNLSVVVVEDSMYDKQEDGLTTDDNYLFMGIFREMVTPYLGTPLGLDKTVKPAGQVYQKVFTYKPKALTGTNPQINPKHCRVIAFVNSPTPGDYHVVQSVQTQLRH